MFGQSRKHGHSCGRARLRLRWLSSAWRTRALPSLRDGSSRGACARWSSVFSQTKRMVVRKSEPTLILGPRSVEARRVGGCPPVTRLARCVPSPVDVPDAFSWLWLVELTARVVLSPSTSAAIGVARSRFVVLNFRTIDSRLITLFWAVSQVVGISTIPASVR